LPRVTVNIGNTLDNTRQWETGWGNPRITKEYIASLAALGFRTVRLPVAWDTYAREGRIQPEKLARVGEVVDWITAAGMFCIVNIHWDGGWIDSSYKARFPDTSRTGTGARCSPRGEARAMSLSCCVFSMRCKSFVPATTYRHSLENSV
jgi:hypothetical protein